MPFEVSDSFSKTNYRSPLANGIRAKNNEVFSTNVIGKFLVRHLIPRAPVVFFAVPAKNSLRARPSGPREPLLEYDNVQRSSENIN